MVTVSYAPAPARIFGIISASLIIFIRVNFTLLTLKYCGVIGLLTSSKFTLASRVFADNVTAGVGLINVRATVISPVNLLEAGKALAAIRYPAQFTVPGTV